jgi:hypothetical protein
MQETPTAPQLEFSLELRVSIGPTVDLGAGSFGIRRTVPITGGTFNGPSIRGRVLPGGADWQRVDAETLTLVDAHYVIETDDGVRIEVRNQGIRHGPPEVLARVVSGQRVSPDEYYFRTNPRFNPPLGKHDWLKRSLFVGFGERSSDLVVVRVWRVL